MDRLILLLTLDVTMFATNLSMPLACLVYWTRTPLNSCAMAPGIGAPVSTANKTNATSAHKIVELTMAPSDP